VIPLALTGLVLFALGGFLHQRDVRRLTTQRDAARTARLSAQEHAIACDHLVSHWRQRALEQAEARDAEVQHLSAILYWVLLEVENRHGLAAAQEIDRAVGQRLQLEGSRLN
jgi:hypothetical protein